MSIDSFRKNKITNFSRDIKKYVIPKGFRMYQGIDLYDAAKTELDLFDKNKLSVEDIFNNPDSALRNVMLLWYNDKKKLNKK